MSNLSNILDNYSKKAAENRQMHSAVRTPFHQLKEGVDYYGIITDVYIPDDKPYIKLTITVFTTLVGTSEEFIFSTKPAARYFLQNMLNTLSIGEDSNMMDMIGKYILMTCSINGSFVNLNILSELSKEEMLEALEKQHNQLASTKSDTTKNSTSLNLDGFELIEEDELCDDEEFNALFS